MKRLDEKVRQDGQTRRHACHCCGPGIVMVVFPSTCLSHSEVIQLFNNVSLLLGLEKEHEQQTDVLRCPSMKNAANRREAREAKID